MNFSLRIDGNRIASYLKSLQIFFYAVTNQYDQIITNEGDFLIFSEE